MKLAPISLRCGVVTGLQIDSAAPSSPSQRERSKAERRKRIVAAARRLVRERGIDNLSMKLLAKRAGVGIATPYNLFGSKQAVMLAVIDQDVAAFQERVAATKHANELAVLF